MTWVSYAQNYEDVVLNRIFKGQDTGYYVDVGAYHPSECSVTKHFYDMGWCGINIDASPTAIAEFRRERERDVNLSMGISNVEGTLPFWLALDGAGGISTFNEEEMKKHVERGYKFSRKGEVPVRRLEDVLEQYMPPGLHIDFMSIDVEGHELEVLEGNDWLRFRPTVVVIEATRPLTQERTYGKWEHVLTGAGYERVYFDGLNAWYVINSWDADLIHGPCVFDDFITVREHALRK